MHLALLENEIRKMSKDIFFKTFLCFSIVPFVVKKNFVFILLSRIIFVFALLSFVFALCSLFFVLCSCNL